MPNYCDGPYIRRPWRICKQGSWRLDQDLDCYLLSKSDYIFHFCFIFWPSKHQPHSLVEIPIKTDEVSFFNTATTHKSRLDAMVGILRRPISTSSRRRGADGTQMDPGHDAVQIDGVGQQPTLEGARKCRDNPLEKFGVVGRTGVDHRHAALLLSAPDVEGGKDPSPPTDEASSQPREGRQKWNYLRSRGGRERDPLPRC